jgi:hypothetical protein
MTQEAIQAAQTAVDNAKAVLKQTEDYLAQVQRQDHKEGVLADLESACLTLGEESALSMRAIIQRIRDHL